MTGLPALAGPGAWLPFLGLAANVTASRDYVLATARGQVRPSCASWFALALIPGLALGAAAAVEAWIGAVTAAAAAVVPTSVLGAAVAAARRGGRRPVRAGPLDVQGYLDAVVLGGCVGAVLVWAITDDPAVVLVDAILIGLFATAPTLVRAWRGHERVGPFLGRVAAATCVLPLVPQWTVVADWMYAAFQLATGALLCVVVVARRPAGGHAVARSRPSSIPAAAFVGPTRGPTHPPGRHRRRRPPGRVAREGM